MSKFDAVFVVFCFSQSMTKLKSLSTGQHAKKIPFLALFPKCYIESQSRFEFDVGSIVHLRCHAAFKSDL